METGFRRYLVEVGGGMVAYVVVLSIATASLNNVDAGSGWRVPLALAPVVFVLSSFVRYFGRIDEFQRRVQLEALAFAFGGTALLAFGYGFLQLVGFPQVRGSVNRTHGRLEGRPSQR